MNKLFLCVSMVVLALMFSCGNSTNKNQSNEPEAQENQEKTTNNQKEDEKDHYVKKNGIIKLQVDGKKLEWVGRSSFTNYLLREPEEIQDWNGFKADKHLQFDFIGPSETYPEGDLVVDKTLSVAVVWSDGNKALVEGEEHKAIVSFVNTLSEGFIYIPNPNIESYGTVKINKVEKVDDFHMWLEGEIECEVFHVLRAEENKPANSATTELYNLKVQFNNLCVIYK